MSIVFRGTAVRCCGDHRLNILVMSSKPMRHGNNFTNRVKKCNIERLLIDIQSMI